MTLPFFIGLLFSLNSLADTSGSLKRLLKEAKRNEIRGNFTSALKAYSAIVGAHYFDFRLKIQKIPIEKAIYIGSIPEELKYVYLKMAYNFYKLHESPKTKLELKEKLETRAVRILKLSEKLLYAPDLPPRYERLFLVFAKYFNYRPRKIETFDNDFAADPSKELEFFDQLEEEISEQKEPPRNRLSHWGYSYNYLSFPTNFTIGEKSYVSSTRALGFGFEKVIHRNSFSLTLGIGYQLGSTRIDYAEDAALFGKSKTTSQGGYGNIQVGYPFLFDTVMIHADLIYLSFNPTLSEDSSDTQFNETRIVPGVGLSFLFRKSYLDFVSYFDSGNDGGFIMLSLRKSL